MPTTTTFLGSGMEMLERVQAAQSHPVVNNENSGNCEATGPRQASRSAEFVPYEEKATYLTVLRDPKEVLGLGLLLPGWHARCVEPCDDR